MQNLKLLFAVIGGTIILIFAASWLFSWQTQSVQEKAEQVVADEKLIPADAHVRGATESAQFTVVEFSDFQCPACQAVHAPMKALLDQYKDKIRFVYRHFPLNSIHKNALIAAKASEAAARQEKFWEMHDKLFATQKEWQALGDPTDFYANLAKELGLDEAKFREDLKSSVVADVVSRDLQLTTELNLAVTPTFYLNGKKSEFSEIVTALQSAE